MAKTPPSDRRKSGEEAVRFPPRLTAISIDGNSIQVAAGEHHGGRLTVTAIEHIETPKLLEFSRRLRHQIFMDVDLCFFPDKPAVTALLKDVLRRPEFSNPCILVLTPDRLELFREDGRAEKRARNDRRRLLLEKHLPRNPLKYPLLFFLQELPMQNGQSRTRLGRGRLADYVQLLDIFRDVGLPLVGMVPAVSAVASMARRMFPPSATRHSTLCHVGKLRTLYSTLLPGGAMEHNMIPVGLARDDMYYFRSFEPLTGALADLRRSKGALFLPAGETPSLLASGNANDPVVDLTQFAIQVARFSARVEEFAVEHGSDPDHGGSYYLSGLASALPGLREFVHERVRSDVRPLSELPLAHVDLAGGVTTALVAENLPAVGALLDTFFPSAVSAGPLAGELSPPPIRGNQCSVTKMEERRLYILEHPLD